MGDKKIKHELWNYDIEFDGEEPADINAVQAASIIRDVLFTLEVPHQNISIKKVVEGVFMVEEGGISIQFTEKEPEYWYAEADLKEKTIRVQINDYVMTIPLTTILMWFKDSKVSNL